MEFKRLIEIVDDEPVFETGLLLAGDVDPDHVRRQLTRWTQAGRVYQLRRGLYALAPPYQKVKPHPFLIANKLLHGSYVSCQSALAFYDLIPEYTPVVVSVSAGRTNRRNTPLGSFMFRHIHRKHFWGYRMQPVSYGQQALIATPEKALLDLIYLTPYVDFMAYVRSLRLQNVEGFNPEGLLSSASRFNKPKMMRAADQLSTLLQVPMEGDGLG